MTQFYSQFGEDKWMAEHLTLPQPGFFVDVGAEDGREGSNTLYFEQQGWTGICIEPNPEILPTLRRNRPRSIIYDYAVGMPQLDAEFYVHPTKGWSGLMAEDLHGSKRVKVEVRALNHILQEAGVFHVDLLSIDTEGTELDVLMSLHIERWRPQIVIVEHNTWDGRVRTDRLLQHFFSRHNYAQRLMTDGNLIFERLEC